MKAMSIAICIDDLEQSPESRLGEKLSLPVVSKSLADDYEYLLFYQQGLLKIQQQHNDDLGDVWVDFCKGKSGYRQKHQGKGKLPVSRACGIKHQHRPSIIDATAGLGQDAFVLATLGCKVDCIEQQPVLCALLEDGLHRARQSEQSLREIADRITVHQGNAELMLSNMSAEVVYLDPMYPHTQNRKQAKVKKAMQLFRGFPGTESNEQALLAAALNSATDRVVVKRPDWASPLADQTPSHQIPGKTHRYDVYKISTS